MKTVASMLLFPLLVVLVPTSSLAQDCSETLEDLEGWTVISVKTIRGEFEGCDYDKLVEFDDGTILRCDDYGYLYSYRPTAVLFGRSFRYQGQEYVSLKMLVEDELYDMTQR